MSAPINIPGFPFEWEDFLNPDEDQLKSIAARKELPMDAVIDCMQSEHLPKHEVYDKYNFVIVRFSDPNCTPNSDSLPRLTRKIAIFFNAEFLLTVHRSETPFLDRIAKKYAGNKAATRPFDVVCKILKYSMETYEEPLNAMNREIDLYESKIFLRKRIPDLLKYLYVVRRKISVFRKLHLIHQMVADSMMALHPRSSFLGDLRDYLLKLHTETEDLYENINHLLNLYISLSGQKTNEVMRILTVFSAFFLPLTFIVGVYGMNFENMPELSHEWGYPGVLMLMFLVTFLIWQWFKRRRWL